MAAALANHVLPADPTAGVSAPVEVRAADPTQNGGKKEVAFVDTNVADYQKLVAGVRAGVEVELIDGTQSGLAQMAKWAETHTGYDAIHVLSHGAEATLHLGSDVVIEATLSTTLVQVELAEVGHALNAAGDLLLYGCDIAKGTDGQRFINDIAAATGADVAASTDLTGSATKGGNWDLESKIGIIDTFGLDFSASRYSGILTQITITSTDTGGNLATDSNASTTSFTRSVAADIGNATLTFGSDGNYIAYQAVDSDPLQLNFKGVFGYSSDFSQQGLTISTTGYTFDLNGFDYGSIQAATVPISLYVAYNSNPTSFTSVKDINLLDTSSHSTTGTSVSSITEVNDVVAIKFVTNVGSVSTFYVLQNFVITDVRKIVSNTAPVISNLNNDSVAWAGVGNSVTLDAGTAASASDTENGSGAWDTATLTVQRYVGSTATPLSADVYGFTQSGFTVSGANLQTGGTTFGTFTNTGGVLTISFNSNSTTALVSSVLAGISYRNDTPSGDTTIRFALTDGSGGSTTTTVALSESLQSFS
ncbi:MAG: DUF4347 domain-containing protein [Rhodospirillaceae bacterium]